MSPFHCNYPVTQRALWVPQLWDCSRLRPPLVCTPEFNLIPQKDVAVLYPERCDEYSTDVAPVSRGTSLP